jgi:4-amino-4-deoxy-L-arabinose transferase-like glycosyltransferase
MTRAPRLNVSKLQSILLPVSFFIGALAIRLPGLLYLPRFEDEGLEVLWALDIARGVRFPLTGSDDYYGPLFAYLVAGTFKVLGVNILWPRLLTAVFGALAVAATYVLGRVIAGPRVGIVGALVMLTSPILILTNSHYGWSSSLTPFFSIVTMTAVFVGVTERRPAMLGVGGLLAGLTLQTHPLTIVLLVSLAIWYLVQCPPREWLRRREMYAGLAGAIVGYAPMIWNLLIASDAVMFRVRQPGYAYDPAPTIDGYLDRLPVLWQLLSHGLAGFGERLWDPRTTFEEFSAYSRIVPVLTCVIVFGLLVRTDRLLDQQRSQPARAFLAIIFVSSALLFPLLTKTFALRYMIHLFPISYVAAGVTVEFLWQRLRDLVMGNADGLSARPPSRWQWALVGALALVLSGATGALVALNIRKLDRSYTMFEERGLTNAAFFELRDHIRRGNICGRSVIVEDKSVIKLVSWAASYIYFNFDSVSYVLAMDGHSVAWKTADQIADLARAQPSPSCVVLSQRSATALAKQLQLTRVASINPEPVVPPEYQIALFLAGPRRPQPSPETSAH